jgi:hypothetical protein
MVTSPITDLVDRLRRSGDYECYCEEAADEIELLRIVLRQLMAAIKSGEYIEPALNSAALVVGE